LELARSSLGETMKNKKCGQYIAPNSTLIHLPKFANKIFIDGKEIPRPKNNNEFWDIVFICESPIKGRSSGLIMPFKQ